MNYTSVSIGRITPPPRVRIPGVDLRIFKNRDEPNQYRLVSSRTISKPVLASIPVKFRFGTRWVSGVATPVNSLHEAVLRLEITSSPIQRGIQRLLTFFPAAFRACFGSLFPEWCLPERVILKPEKDKDTVDKETAAELFDTELKAYKKLRPLQGTSVPILYGQIKYNGARTLIVQDIGAESIREPAGLTFSLTKLVRLLQECISDLEGAGLRQEDAQLSNFIFANGRLVAVDFERVCFEGEEDWAKYCTEAEIEMLVKSYINMRRLGQFEGILEPVLPEEDA